ncbi:MAG: type II toxin-antitoxin system VapC family toxin [Alphaproteobacteria bacterium]|nr:type II toxin-antitoxin system VapC family toxin [Alphaproteobacteria bacterium]
MSFVVDASVALKWFVPEVQSRAAEELLHVQAELHAPDLLVVEIANAAWKKVLRREIDRRQAMSIAFVIHRGGPRLYPSEIFIERAAELAMTLNHSVYDCLYLACAENLGATLVTADARLLKMVADTELARMVRPLSAWQA